MDTQPQKFVMLSIGRSGTNLLQHLLTQHAPERIRCLGEAFHLKEIHLPFEVPGYSTVEQRNSDPGGFIRSLESECLARYPDHLAWGYKLFIHHSLDALRLVCEDPDMRFIVLRRENTLAQYSSFKIANATGQWKQWVQKLPEGCSEADFLRRVEGAPNRVVFDPSDFLLHISKTNGEYGILESLLGADDSRVVRLSYHELASESAVERIGALLNVPRIVPKAIFMVKQNSSNILDRFENPKDVLECLDSIGRLDWATEAPLDTSRIRLYAPSRHQERGI